MWCLDESSISAMHTHIDPFAHTTLSQYLKHGRLPLQFAVVRKVYSARAIEQGVAFVPGAPFYAADANVATLRLSFATADLGKIEEGVT